MRQEKFKKIRATEIQKLYLSRIECIERMTFLTSDPVLLTHLRKIAAAVKPGYHANRSNESENRKIRNLAKGKQKKERHQEKTKATAIKHWQPWAIKDEKLVFETNLTDAELAVKLGRTYHAVRTKRLKLLKRPESSYQRKVAIA